MRVETRQMVAKRVGLELIHSVRCLLQERGTEGELKVKNFTGLFPCVEERAQG